MRCVLAILLIALPSISSAEVLAARPLARGDVLTAADLNATSTEELTVYVGMAVRRPIFEGRVLRPFDVTAPTVVSRQDTVAVHFRRGPLTLEMQGRALGEGSVGDRIDVSLPGRRQPTSAVITAPGSVEVGA
ncbi:MAG: flagellar basal body P-ring formation chaperone FlgA [Pseudomonadota bacterium]